MSIQRDDIKSLSQALSSSFAEVLEEALPTIVDNYRANIKRGKAIGRSAGFPVAPKFKIEESGDGFNVVCSLDDKAKYHWESDPTFISKDNLPLLDKDNQAKDLS